MKTLAFAVLVCTCVTTAMIVRAYDGYRRTGRSNLSLSEIRILASFGIGQIILSIAIAIGTVV